jgi:Family of unknown function (DUF6152)
VHAGLRTFAFCVLVTSIAGPAGPASAPAQAPKPADGRKFRDRRAIEGMSPNHLGRRGWSKNTLKAGDRVTVVIRATATGRKAACSDANSKRRNRGSVFEY